MTLDITIEGPVDGSGAQCERILRLLPEWFGIEQAIVQYTHEIDRLPTFLAKASGEVAGFLSLKQHFPTSAEVLVMGVRPEAHRQGIGRLLLEAAEAWLRLQGVQYLQVKTVSAACLDEGYARTRSFYQAMGFHPLEEIRTLWDENNPCLIYIKRL